MRETFAFLFDSNAPGLSSFYGGSCDRLFFEALLHVERARAYAEAMAGVFEANGIACRVHTYID